MGNFQFGQSKNIIDPIFGSVQTISTAYGSIISTSFGELNLIYVEDGWKLWKKMMPTSKQIWPILLHHLYILAWLPS